MARREARRMFSSSISSGVAPATAYAEASAAITANSRSRRAGESVLESRMAGFSYPCGKITAAAITGPARGPLPASSTPAGERNPRSRALASKPWNGTALLLRRLRRRLGAGAFRLPFRGDGDALLREPVLPLPDARLLPGDLAEIEQLRPADVALLLHLDLLEEGGVDRVGALHSHAVRLLADLEGGGDAVPVEPDDDPLEILDALLLPLLDPREDADGVPHGELREVLAKVRGFDIFQKRHGHILSVILAIAGPETRPVNVFQPLPVCQLLPEQFRAPLGRPPLPFRPAPRLDGPVVPGQEDVGDRPPPELPGAGVVGRLEEPFRKRVVVRRFRVAEHPGEEPGHRVDQHHGGQFPARQDVVPDGDLLVRQVVRHPLVHPLVPAADQDQVLLPGQPGGRIRTEEGPRGGEEDDPARAVVPGERLHPGEDRLRLHHHPAAAAEGRLVGHAVLPLRVLPQVVGLDGQEPRLPRLREDAVGQRPREHPREERQHVDPHVRPPLTTLPAGSPPPAAPPRGGGPPPRRSAARPASRVPVPPPPRSLPRWGSPPRPPPRNPPGPPSRTRPPAGGAARRAAWRRRRLTARPRPPRNRPPST